MVKTLLLAMVLLNGCAHIYPGDGTPVNVSAVGDGWTDVALAALDAGTHMWDAAGVHLRLNDATARETITVHFGNQTPLVTECGEGCDGVFDVDNSEIYVRSQYFGGSHPEGLKQVFAHELGHAIGLNHVKAGIMQPDTAYVDELQPDDYAEYMRVWQ